MKLKLQYDSETDIPEAHRELFEERDGKWHLTGVEGLKTDKDVAAVKAVADKERKRAKELEDKLKRFEKLGEKDPEELLKLEAEVIELRERVEELDDAGDGKKKPAGADEAKELRKQLGKLTAELNQAKKDVETRTKERDEARTESQTLNGKIVRSTVESELTRAATGSKVRTEALADVLLHAGIFEVEEVEENGRTKQVVRTKDGVGVTPGLDVAAWLGEMKSSRPHWWPESTGAGGRGSGGTVSGDNPFSKKAPNLQKAGELARKDPAKALAMAKAEGYRDVQHAVSEMARAAGKAA